MNKVRPYLFWIICGAIVLIELVLMLGFAPSEGETTPEQAKENVDKAKRSLDKKQKKAVHAPPANREFDPLVKADIDELTNDYLATDSWKPPLSAELQRYSEQLTKIKTHLLDRSAILHTKISSEQNIQWYDAYVKATSELMQKLYDSGCLKLPKAGVPGMPPGVGGPVGGVPSGGGPAAISAARAGGDSSGSAADAADPKPNFNDDAGTRSVAGFKTFQRYDDLQYDELTLHYHIMDMVAGALEDAVASNLASPAALNKKPSDSHVKLVKTVPAQEGGGGDENVHVVTITLEGPLSALLAAEAALEENRNGQQAVRAVIGGKLWRPAYTGDEALHVSSEPLDMELEIAFLDFTDLTNVNTDVMPQAKAAPPAPPPKPASAPARPAGGDEPGG